MAVEIKYHLFTNAGKQITRKARGLAELREVASEFAGKHGTLQVVRAGSEPRISKAAPMRPSGQKMGIVVRVKGGLVVTASPVPWAEANHIARELSMKSGFSHSVRTV